MSEQLIQGIVRILDESGDVAGTGFVVSESGLIATCSHVIQHEDLQERHAPRPENVKVLFYVTGDELDAYVEPDYWLPWNAGDLALIQVKGIMPSNVRPLPLGSSEGTNGHDICTFGFPDIGDIEGIGGDGKVVRSLSRAGQPLIQLRSNEITEGFSGAPIWDKLKRRVIGIISDITKPDPHHRLVETAFAISTETLQKICPALQISEVCPYQGLAAFREADAEFFFGRQQVIDGLLNRLRTEPRFLTVLGPSGSGKSSVVQAGFIPQLRSGKVPGSDRWGIMVTRPADNPFDELAKQGLSDGSHDLTESVRSWLSQHPEQERLVLVFDQFEELFVTCPEVLRQSFVVQITQLSHSPLLISVILVMRDDFYSRLTQHETLVKWLEQSRGPINVPQILKQDELIDMVQKPAEAVGLRFEEGLVEVMVRDTMEASVEAEDGGQAGRSTVLPLLEFALSELWKRRQEGMLTHEAYTRIGAVVGALTQWADRAFFELKSEEQQQLAHRIFTDLIYLGDKSQGILDSRRRRALTSLCRQDHEQQEVQHVVQHLVENRLIITDRDIQTSDEIVEIIHDVLLRTWGRLKHWIEEDRDFLEWHQALERQAQIWVEKDRKDPSKRDKDKLLRGSDLKQAIDYSHTRYGELNRIEREFIAASQARRKFEGRRRALFIVGGTAVLGVALVGGSTATTIVDLINNTLLEKQNLLKHVEALTPDVNISEYKKIFGDPKFINQNGSQYFINRPGVKKFKEYVFINKYFYLDAVTDLSDRVQYFALTIRDKAFNPTFTMPVSQTASIAQITLGISTFKDIPTTPMYISGCVGAHDVYYHEIYYFGNQGRYEQFGFGLNEAGYLANKYEDYIPSLVKINLCLSPTGDRPTFTEQDLVNLQPMRTKTIFNTYAVSAPNVSIEDYNMKMDLGIVYDQVRTTHG